MGWEIPATGNAKVPIWFLMLMKKSLFPLSMVSHVFGMSLARLHLLPLRMLWSGCVCKGTTYFAVFVALPDCSNFFFFCDQ